MADTPKTKHFCPQCDALLLVGAAYCPSCAYPRSSVGWPEDELLHTVIAGRYQILGILGRGGFGAVYEAEHVRLGGRRAIKVPRNDMAYDDSLRERFRREAKALYQLNAPQLVKVEEYGTLDDGRPFMVMELASGDRLDTLVYQGGPLTALRCIRITRQILLALDEAHRHGILHRDLKAENIMVESDPAFGERVKVLDLGIARILADARRLTSETRTLGTPEYMSPEQWRGEDDIDGRADLYSVGILMYEMLTGDVPYPRSLGGPGGIYTLVMNSRPPPISRKRKDLPAGLEALALRLCRRERNARPADAIATLEELERVRRSMRERGDA